MEISIKIEIFKKFLYVIKQNNMEQEKKHGGYRPGAGRPATDRSHAVTIRISEEAFQKLNGYKNKSEKIDQLIKEHL